MWKSNVSPRTQNRFQSIVEKRAIEKSDYVNHFTYEAYLETKGRILKKKSLGKFLIIDTPIKAYKKLAANFICSLEIPVGAIVYYGGGFKLRASMGKVAAIWDPGRKIHCKKWFSFHDSKFNYEVGKMVHSTKPFSLVDSECQSGIHFFINLEDALTY